MAGELAHATVGTVLSQAEFEDTALHTMTYSTWAPTVTQSTAQSVTVTYANYALIGKFVHAHAFITVNSSGTAGQAIVIGNVPAAIAPRYTGVNRICGVIIFGFSTGTYSANVEAATASTLKALGYNVQDYFGAAPSIALAATETLSLDLFYETT